MSAPLTFAGCAWRRNACLSLYRNVNSWTGGQVPCGNTAYLARRARWDDLPVLAHYACWALRINNAGCDNNWPGLILKHEEMTTSAFSAWRPCPQWLRASG